MPTCLMLIFFNGEQVVKSDELMEMDTDLSTLIAGKELLESLSRRWDVVKRTNKGCFQIMAIESQQNIHYAMPLRCMLYEALAYVAAMKYIVKKDSGRKWNDSDEFLSKLKKEDRLPPCYCIVIYAGEKPWDGPVKLSEMMDIPRSFAGVHFNNYKMNLIELNKPVEYPFQEEHVRDFFRLVEALYSNKLEHVLDDFRDVEDDIWYAGFAVTGIKEFELLVNKSGKGKLNMCENVKRQLEEMRNEAMAAGESVGKIAGRAEGKAEERQRLLNTALANGCTNEMLICLGFTEEEIKAVLS